MIDAITQSLVSFARDVPLPLFTFLGSFIEEVLVPVPSPVVMTVTGSIASAQNVTILGLLPLSVIGAVGKTIGAVIVYAVARKAEMLLFGRTGKFMGVTHEEVVQFGKKLKGDWHDYLLMTFLRALPIMSSGVVSVGSGIVKVPFRVYLVSTFVGTIIRDFFYLYVGYSGVEAYHTMVEGFDDIESILQLIIAAVVVIVFLFIAYTRWRRERGGRRTS